MALPLGLKVDARSPIPIRRQLSEQLKHAIEGGGIARDQALPSIRELAGSLGINPNTVARVIEDLKRSGHVEARRGRGVFVAPVAPVHPSPQLRERLLQDVVLRAAALGMTADELAVGLLSVAAARPAVHEALPVLVVECSASEVDFLGAALQEQLPVTVDKVLLEDLATVVRRQKPAAPWRAAVTSFGHLPELERRLRGKGIPVIPLLAGARVETLHDLARLPTGTRVGVVAAAGPAAHTLEPSIANAALPNIELAGVCPAEGTALGRLVRRVDVVVCSTSAAERVRALAGPTVRVMVDDRAVDPRTVEALAELLVRRDGGSAASVGAPERGSEVRNARPRATRATVRTQ